jgi:Mrp family chromosome partitioning ATPase/predicted  nucleic acid-binding Zn-ribbon protein
MPFQTPTETAPPELELGVIVVKTLKLLVRNRWMLALLCVGSMTSIYIDHCFFPSFTGRSTVYLKDANNNPLQAISSKLGGNNLQEFKSVPEKYLLYLRSNEFFLRSAKALRHSPEFSNVSKSPFFHRQSIGPWFLDFVFFRFFSNENRLLTDDFVANAISYWVSFSPNTTESFTITVITPDPELTLLLSNVLAKVAVEALTDQDLLEVNEAHGYLAEELEKTQSEIDRIETAIAFFKVNTRTTSGESGLNEVTSKFANLRSELDELTVEIRQNEELLKALNKKKQDIQAQSGLVDTEQSKFGINYRIDDLMRSNQYLQIRKDSIKKTLDEILNAQNPHGEQKIFDLRKRMETEYSLFQELKGQIFQVEMLRIAAKNRVYKLDDIRRSEVQRSTSLSKKTLLGLIFSLLLGLAIAYVKELTIPRVRDRRDLQRFGIGFLGNLPNLRPLTAFAELKTIVGRKPPRREKLIQLEHDSAWANPLKAIRTRVFNISDTERRPPQIITIISGEAGDGKSFFCMNLAACIGNAQQRTLLIDCDTRVRSCSDYFGCSSGEGLLEVLTAPDQFSSVVKRNILPQVDFLPAGKASTAGYDLLSGSKMLKLIEELRTVYRYIILDTASLDRNTESILLAKRSDLAIIVAQKDQTRLESIERTVEFLRDVGQNRIYSILNRTTATEPKQVFHLPLDLGPPPSTREQSPRGSYELSP